MHEGHRERVKQRVISEGIEAFAPHEILEYLLFYCIPRRDVNPLAHQLIDAFGSMSAVLEADADDLAAIPGMTRNAAILLSSIPQINRAMAREALRERPKLENWRDAADFALSFYLGRRYETFALLCLDAKKRVTACPVISEGTLEESPVYPRRIAETALRNKARYIIMVHNHPSGTLRFSLADAIATAAIIDALLAIEITVIDHILIADHRALSMAHEHILESLSAIIAGGRDHAETVETVAEARKVADQRAMTIVRRPATATSLQEIQEDGWARQIIAGTTSSDDC